MKTDHHQHTAKIYIFPVGGRAKKTVTDEYDKLKSNEFDSYIDVDSWYHQEAIDESSTSKPRKQ